MALEGLFLGAVLGSCSKDIKILDKHETPDNQISFNVSASSSSKGADLTTASISELTASAIWKETPTSGGVNYFTGVSFTRSGQSFVSASPYYWPEKGTMDFHAYSPSSSFQIGYPQGGYGSFKVTPGEYASTQVDLIYANTNGKLKSGIYGGSTYSLYGVPLNFRHTESKVTVRVKNSSESLNFNITDVKVAFLSKSGTFTYATANAQGQKDESTDGVGTLNAWDWTYGGEDEAPSVGNTYEQTFPEQSVQYGSSTSMPLEGSTDWILLPQTVRMATKYETEDTGKPAAGSYVSLNVEIRNNDKNIDTDGKEGLLIYKGWAMWPVAFEWAPGYHYTYTVDLCGGGYYETNQENINPGTADLDPILENALIRFVPVTVEPWELSSYDIEVTD